MTLAPRTAKVYLAVAAVGNVAWAAVLWMGGAL